MFWCKKNTNLLPEIGKYFGVSANWLKNGSESNDGELVLMEEAIYNRFHKIPLLHNLSTSMLHNNKLNLNIDYDSFELTKDPEHENLFALVTTNNSLKFKFGHNTTLIFHTNLNPTAGDFVVAYLMEKDLFIYRDLIIENGKKTLVPIDPDLYKKIHVDEMGCLIVAVLYEKRTKRTIDEKMQSWNIENPSNLY